MKYLPFRRKLMDNGYLLTNEVGQYYFLSEEDYSLFINTPYNLPTDIRDDLISKFFLSRDEYFNYSLNESAIKLRTKKDFLNYFTSLHIVVLTHNCNSNCSYCHASSHYEEIVPELMMPNRIARRVCEKIIESPSPSIKIEFQGGEPTINFETLQFIVEYIKVLNRKMKKSIEFVICTNLLDLSDVHLNYFIKNDIFISTSLDGPSFIHDEYRKSINDIPNSIKVLKNINRIQTEYGKNKVSALMTVSYKALKNIKKCVDSYIDADLHTIFLRPINPYGMAQKTQEYMYYDVEDYLDVYKKTLEYIVEVNVKGNFLREEYASVFLRKILTPFSNGFVDIQSPPGDGIGCAVYDIDGGVYVSDESRMLAKNGDFQFLIGNVEKNSFQQIFNSTKLQDLIHDHIAEASPGCFGCPYIPYCGLDAVRLYQERKLHIENSSCKRNKGILDIIFNLLQTNTDAENVFWGWVTNRSYKEVLE